MDPDVAGNPQTEQRWICQSLSKVKAALAERTDTLLSRETIRGLLNDQKIRPKSNVKRLHPKPHPERDQQFAYLKGQRAAFARAGWPCVSVDTKKKELLGNFFNRGRQWCREATAVNTHDFPSYATGKAVPYGLYDVGQNLGYVALGQSADTPELAVDALVWWWRQFGKDLYPTAPELMILADGGGSNGCRPRLWKQQLQVKLADAFGLSVTVCHYPTGASKWNPIEHRLFSQVSRTWAATPLTSYDVVLEGLRSTTTVTGLRVEATLFDALYQKGLRVTDEEKVPGAAGMASLLIEKHALCPQWNYTIRPRKTGGNS
ncbi:MAG: ISAzo13 family transposase [Gemmatimonadota bacterium]|nr:ISAzo13 family transposase [Gemmatimonadota bacterium]